MDLAVVVEDHHSDVVIGKHVRLHLVLFPHCNQKKKQMMKMMKMMKMLKMMKMMKMMKMRKMMKMINFTTCRL